MEKYFSLLIWVVVIAAMMFFMTRSQKKQQKERQEQLGSMQVGSKVVTIGGLHGVISEINEAEKTVTLDCEGIFLVFNRAAISTVKPATTKPTEAQATEVIENTESKEDSE